MKTKSTFWGTIFIIAGALLLLSNLGILTVNVWKLVWPSFIIAMGVWTLIAAQKGAEALETEEVSLPLKNATRAKLTVAFGAGQFHIHSTPNANKLLSGSFIGGVEEKVHQDGDFTKIKLQARSDDFLHVIMPWSWGARNWNFGLNKDIAWQLSLEMGASDAHVNLTDVHVTDLKVETGASNTDIILPANAGVTHVDLDGGAASVTFTVPKGVAARIQVDSGLSSIDIDRQRFPRVGDYYKSEDYETAANKVDINADFGAGSLVIR